MKPQNDSGRIATSLVNLVLASVTWSSSLNGGELQLYWFLFPSTPGFQATKEENIMTSGWPFCSGNSDAVLHLEKTTLSDWDTEVLPNTYGYSDFHQSLWECKSSSWKLNPWSTTEQSCWENLASPPKGSNSVLLYNGGWEAAAQGRGINPWLSWNHSPAALTLGCILSWHFS